MAKIKIAYYFVAKNGRGYWNPSKKMKAEGVRAKACGMDGPDAWAIADQCNRDYAEGKHKKNTGMSR